MTENKFLRIGKNILWLLLLLLISQIPSFSLGLVIGFGLSRTIWVTIAMIILVLICIFLSIWIAQKKQIFDFDKPLFTLKNVGITVASYFGLIVCLVVFSTLLMDAGKVTTGNQEVAQELFASQSRIVMFFFIAVAAPIMEELVFRGGIIKLFFDGPKLKWLGLIVASCLFSSLHMIGFDPISFLLYASMGFMLGLPYILTGRIELSMLLHFINNFIGFLNM